MKNKIIVAAALAALSNSAIAEWTWTGDAGELKFYVDSATIKKNENLVQMSTLLSYKTTQKNEHYSRTTQKEESYSYLSEKSQDEFNCKEKKSRALAIYFYADNSGTGEAVYFVDSSNNSWVSLKHGSIGETNWKIACEIVE